jgi:hypothetical protein
VSLGSLVAPGVALAAFPGDNGKIAFARNNCNAVACPFDVFTVDPDGTDLTEVASPGTHPAWSPDGTKLAFSDGSRIIVSNPDGSSATPILDWGASVEGLTWSPDGGKLAAALVTCSDDECRPDIYTLNLDGSGLDDLTPDFLPDRDPSWSPDGSKIAFGTVRDANYEIFVVNADGTGATNLTNGGPDEKDPNWSPDGARVAFEQSSGNHRNISVMNPDGSGRQLLDTPEPALEPAWSPDGSLIAYVAGEFAGNSIHAINPETSFDAVVVHEQYFKYLYPDWQPVQPPITGYPRPKGATPMFVPFVPAYQGCASPNSTHGTPLAFGSCAPPSQASGQLTIGTPDANGQPARARGFLQLRALRGNPLVPGDEADVEVILRAGDVRTAAGLADYTGELSLRTALRITDQASSPSPPAATVEDVPFSAPVACAATSDTLQGSDCYLDTSIDAILGGNAVVEGARTIWELGQVQLWDGGPDGDATTEPNTLFEVQGVFAP